MGTNQALDYHQRSSCTPSFKGGKKNLELVLFSLLVSCSVPRRVEVL
jgi:hypothetical protein